MTEEQKVSPIIYIYDDETITDPIGWGGGSFAKMCDEQKYHVCWEPGSGSATIISVLAPKLICFCC